MGKPRIILDSEEFKRCRGGKEPRWGTLELLGQKCRISWPGYAKGFQTLHKQDIPVMPCYLKCNNTSCLFSALEQALPGLGVKRLKEMAMHIKLLALAIDADGSSVNVRLKLAYGKHVNDHNRSVRDGMLGGGYILLIDITCAAHIIHGFIAKIFGFKQLIPRLHATAFCCTMPAFEAAIWKALRSVVAEDLATNFFPACSPPDGAREHARKVLDMTLLRHEATRGRHGHEASAAREEEFHALVDSLLLCLNGWWTIACVQHFCPCGCPCGQDLQVAIDKITSILFLAWFQPLSARLPSIIKWSCVGPTLASQGGGLMCHQILNRVLVRILQPSENDMRNAENNSYHHHCNKKRRQSLEFLSTQPEAVDTVVTALVATESVDKLTARAQHLDIEGQALVEVVAEKGCALHVPASRGRLDCSTRGRLVFRRVLRCCKTHRGCRPQCFRQEGNVPQVAGDVFGCRCCSVVALDTGILGLALEVVAGREACGPAERRDDAIVYRVFQ